MKMYVILYGITVIMGSLSEQQKQFVEEYLEFATNTFGVDSTGVLNAVLVCMGERDGCLTGLQDENAEFVTDLCEEYIIPYASDNNGVFFAKSDSHLSRYHPVGADAKTTGNFLGYPEAAIEFYDIHPDPASDSDRFLSESSTFDESDWSDWYLIGYIPESTEEAYQKAERKQKQYEEALRSCAVDFSGIRNL